MNTKGAITRSNAYFPGKLQLKARLPGCRDRSEQVVRALLFFSLIVDTKYIHWRVEDEGSGVCDSVAQYTRAPPHQPADATGGVPPEAKGDLPNEQV